jgi:hypothetical protein
MSNSIRDAFFKSNIGLTSIVDTIEIKAQKRSVILQTALKNNLKIVSVRHGVDVSSLLNIIDHEDRWSGWCRNVSMNMDFDGETSPELSAKYDSVMTAIDRMTDDLDPEGYRFDKTGRPAWISNLQAGLKACNLIW